MSIIMTLNDHVIMLKGRIQEVVITLEVFGNTIFLAG